ncbi:hypothetical protein LH433_10590 [Laribacter hongkongensis]|uniref:hypothetical protein n=1 Tax=Laribacter hongkongensis TaxID=168471 RepID=UPI001EFC3C14|nr:hypothetical protein [Laribacter hongkongensis]MCG9107191.1 hypothetical protein [Laribacter hongkongensis]
MGWNDHLDDSELGNLPPEAWGNVFDVDGPFDPDDFWLERANEDDQRIAMREWFTARYCDPAYETPYNGREGGYLFVNGGPYDPADELHNRFGKLVPGEVIQSVVEELVMEVGDEWAPFLYEPPPDYDDKRFELESVVPATPATTSQPLSTQTVLIDDQCIGERWNEHDGISLAKLIAIIAMGQAAYAAHILRELLPAAPAFSDADLRQEARVRMTVQDDANTPRIGYPRWQRDGFIFEAISWIAARQVYGKNVLLKDPHISATSQGLDGLMIELAPDKSKVLMTTIFEDKCTDNPRSTFLQKVIPAFLDRHKNTRAAELVATASVLLRMSGIDEGTAAKLAANVMDRTQRRYRAAFALPKDQDSQAERQKLFTDYDKLDGLSQDRRIGASLIVEGKVRDWFDSLAKQAISYLDDLE